MYSSTLGYIGTGGTFRTCAGRRLNGETCRRQFWQTIESEPITCHTHRDQEPEIREALGLGDMHPRFLKEA